MIDELLELQGRLMETKHSLLRLQANLLGRLRSLTRQLPPDDPARPSLEAHIGLLEEAVCRPRAQGQPNN